MAKRDGAITHPCFTPIQMATGFVSVSLVIMRTVPGILNNNNNNNKIIIFICNASYIRKNVRSEAHIHCNSYIFKIFIISLDLHV